MDQVRCILLAWLYSHIELERLVVVIKDRVPASLYLEQDSLKTGEGCMTLNLSRDSIMDLVGYILLAWLYSHIELEALEVVTMTVKDRGPRLS
ncbi:hypothetical protein RRG08_043991 [Elysia crispata]|uniref:Uncharacterized protein n=1 Tax=Elysia crispata TaxID=231223 RepID=A0AAE1DGA1_9GAST|nr:hypothetical protein RRG08_043991 [Elysia crispata]